MKLLKTRIMVTVLTFALIVPALFGNEMVANAASYTAKSLSELAEIVRVQGMNRNKDFTVKYTGAASDINYVFREDNAFFYYDMILKDNLSTSDDSDYLVGNIDFSKDSCSAVGDEFRFTLSYFEEKDETEYVNEHTTEILSELGVKTMSNYDKVKAVHDYVCDLITYDDQSEKSSSVYGAYTEQKGLCNSYALCMYKLLTEAGVPCKWIGGSAGTGRDAQGHAWNIVQLGNKWYNLDATWDDAEDELTHDYFLKGSSDFDASDPSQVHKMDAVYTATNYLNLFPIASTSFVKGSNDVNTVKNPTYDDAKGNGGTGTGGNANGGGSQNSSVNTKVTYNFSKVIIGKYPSKGKMTIKKKKWNDIQLFIKSKAMKKNISKFTYKIMSGKKYVSAKSYGINKDSGIYFYDLGVKGKKKGTAKIRITVIMKNGQKKNYNFTVKVK